MTTGINKNHISIHEMCYSQCFTLPNGRVYEAKYTRDEKAAIYYEDECIGFWRHRNKRNFTIFRQQHGLLFESNVKYADVTMYGEKSNCYNRVGHDTCVKFVNKQKSK